MIFFRYLFTFLFILMNFGCVANYKYQGSNLPSLYSSSFPSYPVVSEIKDGIKVKIAEGSGKSKILMDFKATKNPKSGFEKCEMIWKTDIDWNWDINIDKGLIYNNHVMNIDFQGHNNNRDIILTLIGVHDLTGNEISLNYSLDGDRSDVNVEQLKKLKEEMSRNIRNMFVNLGKTIKTGDILKSVPNTMANMKTANEGNTKYEIPEIVKGFGFYNGINVVVTEYVMEDSIRNPDLIMEFRGKGYNLYDAETFIGLYGKAVIYMTYFTNKEGTSYGKIDIINESNDIEVKNILDSRNNTDIISIGETNKSSWQEISEKIKSLGELHEKGLITKEEYEMKKKELLKQF